MQGLRSSDLIPVPPDILPMSVVLLESPRWLVGVPLTPWAAAWWGSWTGWCTAVDDGAFHFYHRRGPLLVFRQRETSWRWQLHAATGEFRNCGNRRVSWRGFLGKYPEVSEALVAALARGLDAEESWGLGPEAPAAGGFLS